MREASLRFMDWVDWSMMRARRPRSQAGRYWAGRPRSQVGRYRAGYVAGSISNNANRMTTDPIQAFIQRWEKSGGAERANYQLFLTQLCEVLQVPGPDESKPLESENAYVFERIIHFVDASGKTSPGWIDLYKRGCFVLEAKQGSEKRDRSEPLSEVEKIRVSQRKKGDRGSRDARLGLRDDRGPRQGGTIRSRFAA